MSGPLGTSGGGAAGVTSVTAGNGITVTGTTTPTIAASLAAGTGIGISGTTTLTVTNSGVTSLAGTGVSVSASTGAVTITAPVVAGGTGISVSGSQTTSLTVTNSGVTSLVAGTNISVSASTGAVTVNAPAFGTTITASTIGGTAAAGTSTSVAREDHKHAFPAGAAPSALLVASTQATGTSASPALADHVHAMPGSAVAGASAVGDTAATGSATTVALSDHRHSREAFGTPVVVNAQTTSLATGSLTTLARADHVHTVSNVRFLIASSTLSSNTQYVTFTSIPQTFTDLELVFGTRMASGNTSVWYYAAITFNGDTSNNYIYYGLQPAMLAGIHHGSSNFQVGLTLNSVYIPMYTGSQVKIANLVMAGFNNSNTAYSASDYTGFHAWLGTAAITSIRIGELGGNNLASPSYFRLYGIP